MKAATVPLMLILWAGLGAGAFGSESADEARSVEARKDEAKTVATADSGAIGGKKYKLPPGFKQKKHGKHVLYCKRDATMGTRLQSEKCLSEDQMRDYIIALQENKSDLDRLRSTCSNYCVCGGTC